MKTKRNYSVYSCTTEPVKHTDGLVSLFHPWRLRRLIFVQIRISVLLNDYRSCNSVEILLVTFYLIPCWYVWYVHYNGIKTYTAIQIQHQTPGSSGLKTRKHSVKENRSMPQDWYRSLVFQNPTGLRMLKHALKYVTRLVPNYILVVLSLDWPNIYAFNSILPCFFRGK